MTAWTQASKKWSLHLSTGYFSDLAGLRTVLKVLLREALIPSGGSKTHLYDYLSNVRGIFGLNSVVRNNLKLSWS